MPSETATGGIFMPSTQPDHLAIAEDNMLAERDRLRKELAALDKLISNMQAVRMTGSPQMIPPVRENEYKGMRPVDALESYLRSRRGLKIPLSRVSQDLVAGGVNHGEARGKQNDPVKLVEHNLRISFPNKRRLFSWEPDGPTEGIASEKILVWLAPTAEEPKKRKR